MAPPKIFLPEFVARLLEFAADAGVPQGLLGCLPFLWGRWPTHLAPEWTAVAVDEVVMVELATRLLGEAFAATEERGIERILLRLLAFAEGLWVNSFGGRGATLSRRPRLAGGALDAAPVPVLVRPVSRPEAPASER